MLVNAVPLSETIILASSRNYSVNHCSVGETTIGTIGGIGVLGVQSETKFV